MVCCNVDDSSDGGVKKSRPNMRRRIVVALSVGIIAVFAIFFVFYFYPSSSPEKFFPDVPFYLEIILNETQRIKSFQSLSGAIGSTFPPTKIFPSYALIGAMASFEDPDTISIGRRYLEWHIRNLNIANGRLKYTIDDFEYKVQTKMIDGKETHEEVITTLGKYESPVLPAALFISTLKKYAEVTQDIAFIQENKDIISNVLGVLTSLMNNSLVKCDEGAKPNYMLDNSKVYKAFIDAAWIYLNILKDKNESNTWVKLASEIHVAIEKAFWNSEAGGYRTAFPTDPNGPIWSTLFPDSIAQLSSWTEEIIPPTGRAQEIWKKFNYYNSQWFNLTRGSFFPSPWSVTAPASCLIGDYYKADLFLKIHSKGYMRNPGDRWLVQDAAYSVLAATLLREKYQ